MNLAGKKGPENGKHPPKDYKRVKVTVEAPKALAGDDGFFRTRNMKEDPWYRAERYGGVGGLRVNPGEPARYEISTQAGIVKMIRREGHFKVISVKNEALESRRADKTLGAMKTKTSWAKHKRRGGKKSGNKASRAAAKAALRRGDWDEDCDEAAASDAFAQAQAKRVPGRGKAQKAFMAWMFMPGGKDREWASASRRPEFRGIHFAKIMSAVEALVKAGHLAWADGKKTKVRLAESGAVLHHYHQPVRTNGVPLVQDVRASVTEHEATLPAHALRIARQVEEMAAPDYDYQAYTQRYGRVKAENAEAGPQLSQPQFDRLATTYFTLARAYGERLHRAARAIGAGDHRVVLPAPAPQMLDLERQLHY